MKLSDFIAGIFLVAVAMYAGHQTFLGVHVKDSPCYQFSVFNGDVK